MKLMTREEFKNAFYSLTDEQKNVVYYVVGLITGDFKDFLKELTDEQRAAVHFIISEALLGLKEKEGKNE